MSRQMFLFGIGITLIGLAFVVTNESLGPRPGVTRLNFNRIRPGMTVKEVELLLGDSAEISIDCRTNRQNLPSGNVVEPDGVEMLWYGKAGCISVDFNNELRVRSATIDPNGERLITYSVYVSPFKPTPIDRLRSWLGW